VNFEDSIYQPTRFVLRYSTIEDAIVDCEDGNTMVIPLQICSLLGAWSKADRVKDFAERYCRALAAHSNSIGSVPLLRWARQYLLRRVPSNLIQQMPIYRHVVSLIRDAIKLGLLVDCAEGNEAFVTRPESFMIAIPTADRPDSLEATLLDLQLYAETSECSFDVTICDSSRSEECRIRNREVAADFRRRTGVAVLLVDEHCQKAIASRLIEYAVPEDVVATLFQPDSPFTYGAARNLLLITSSGRKILWIDDDVSPVNTATDSDGSYSYNDHFPMRLSLPQQSGSDGLRRAALRLDADLSLLGTNTSPLRWRARQRMNGNDTPREAAPPSPALLGFITFGSTGHSGMYSPVPALLSAFAIDSEALHDDETYHRVCSQPYIDRLINERVIGKGTLHCGMCFAQDTSTGTVPYFPRFRNEEGSYLRLMQLCYPAVLWGSSPAFVRHRNPAQSYATDWINACLTLRVSDYQIELIPAAMFPHPLSSQFKVRWCGRYLRELGGLPVVEFATYLSSISEKIWLDRIGHVDQAIKRAKVGTAFHHDLETVSKRLRELVASNASPCPVELQHLHDRGSWMQAMQSDIFSFGDALAHWETIWEHSYCKEFKDVLHRFLL